MTIGRCCGATCDCKGGGPHWGDVVVVDEDVTYDEDGEPCDHTWIHACEGHAEMVANGTREPGDYIPPPPGCTTVRESDDQEDGR